MAQYLAEEHLNSEGEPDKKTRSAMLLSRPEKRCLYQKKVKLVMDQEDDTDSSHDSNFISESSDSDSSSFKFR